MRDLLKYFMLVGLLVFGLSITSCASDDDDDDVVTATDDDDDNDDDEPEIPANFVASYSCDINQMFDFQIDSQVKIGVLNSLTIGEQSYDADFQVTDPENPSGTLNVVGVLSNIYYELGYDDPIQFSAQVSTANKNLLSTLVHTSLTNTSVEFEFTVYAYDPEPKVYYKAFHSNDTVLHGMILNDGGELEIEMGSEQNMEVADPINFTFDLGVSPEDFEAQLVYIAMAVGMEIPRQWGVTREAK